MVYMTSLGKSERNKHKLLVYLSQLFLAEKT